MTATSVETELVFIEMEQLEKEIPCDLKERGVPHDHAAEIIVRVVCPKGRGVVLDEWCWAGWDKFHAPGLDAICEIGGMCGHRGPIDDFASVVNVLKPRSG